MKNITIYMTLAFITSLMSGCAHKQAPTNVLNKTKTQINHSLHEMHESLELAVDEFSALGELTGDQAQAILAALYEANDYAYDCATINTEGIIVAIAPKEAERSLGLDISVEPHLKTSIEEQIPQVSTAIDTAEGFTGFALVHPLVNESGEFFGLVEILTEPSFFGHVIDHQMETYDVSIWIMQKDGRIIYDTNPDEIGRNLFTDPLYASYTELIAVGHTMVAQVEGESGYTFRSRETGEDVNKAISWTTIELHGTEFRLALSRVLP